jgi:hypothetical protein
MNIIRTGVFATEEEVKRAIELYQIAQRTPVIAMSVRHGIERGGFAGEAWTHMQETVHNYALGHGLPDFSGYYGLDTGNREFIMAGDPTEPPEAA